MESLKNGSIANIDTTIDVATLRDWLDQEHDVTVLDIRPTAQRVEWAIPGSIHVDAYDAVKAHDDQALAHLDLPPDQPIVVVCLAGKTSRSAAHQLRERGLTALSLDGGMQAWSLAWNTAEVQIPGNAARVVQVRRTGKGCLSYLIGVDGAAAVIDAVLDPAIYLHIAESNGWHITAVLDTHIHADHLSRSRALAAAADVRLYLPEQQRAAFPFTALHDGEAITLGSTRLMALHTPGHTLESTTYVLDDHALFTGDTLFLASVGRPDLEANVGETRERAHLLYASLRRLLNYPPDALVLPGHTSNPVAFDRRPIAATLAEVYRQTPHLHLPEAEFVEEVLSHIPPAPPNYHEIIGLNEAGMLPEGDPTRLEAGANRCAIA